MFCCGEPSGLEPLRWRAASCSAGMRARVRWRPTSALKVDRSAILWRSAQEATRLLSEKLGTICGLIGQGEGAGGGAGSEPSGRVMAVLRRGMQARPCQLQRPANQDWRHPPASTNQPNALKQTRKQSSAAHRGVAQHFPRQGVGAGAVALAALLEPHLNRAALVALRVSTSTRGGGCGWVSQGQQQRCNRRRLGRAVETSLARRRGVPACPAAAVPQRKIAASTPLPACSPCCLLYPSRTHLHQGLSSPLPV